MTYIDNGPRAGCVILANGDGTARFRPYVVPFYVGIKASKFWAQKLALDAFSGAFFFAPKARISSKDWLSPVLFALWSPNSMRFLEALNSDYTFLILGSIMAFAMAVLRCLRFEHKDKTMIFTEAGMCTMITLSVSIGAKTTWAIPYNWSIPVGVFVGFIGTSVINMLIKRFISFVVSYYTGNADLPDAAKKPAQQSKGDMNDQSN